jgi:hypothetical protein
MAEQDGSTDSASDVFDRCPTRTKVKATAYAVCHPLLEANFEVTAIAQTTTILFQIIFGGAVG